jgi:hypothetical protein
LIYRDIFNRDYRIEGQTAELVSVALDIFLGTNFSAPGMYFITTFAI